MDPYVAGVLVGIGSAAVVIAVMAAVRKKHNEPPTELSSPAQSSPVFFFPQPTRQVTKPSATIPPQTQPKHKPKKPFPF